MNKIYFFNDCTVNFIVYSARNKCKKQNANSTMSYKVYYRARYSFYFLVVSLTEYTIVLGIR